MIQLARARVQAGGVSERRLARLAEISQPHLHNVLKGIRTLSPEATDRLMRALDVSIPEVIWSGGEIQASDIRAIPLLRDRIGPGYVASFETFRGYMPFPARLVATLVEPLAAWLATDLSLPAEFRAGDLVLLDQNTGERMASGLAGGRLVVENAGVRVRYVRRVRGTLEVAGNLTGPGHWRRISLRGRDVLDIVRARIVWIGRELETPFAGSPDPPRAGD